MTGSEFRNNTFLHVCTQDWGGAGIAAKRLHRAMLSHGVNSTLVVRDKRDDSQGVHEIGGSGRAYFVDKLINTGLRKLMFHEKYYVSSAVAFQNPEIVDEICELGSSADVIVLHWIANFLSYRDVQQICSRVDSKVVWYVLDMAAFTGGCHYSWGCLEYQTGCVGCPAARLTAFSVVIRRSLAYKTSVIDRCRISLVAPNQWVRTQILKSALSPPSVPVAYIPISSSTFKPKQFEESSTKVPPPLRILFGSVDFHHPRKGADLFVNAMIKLDAILKSVPDPEISRPVVLLPSNGENDSLGRLIPFDIRWIGRAHNDHDLARMYASADLFVSTSVEDSGPLMITEALMTGIPVVSFQVGVAAELIVDGTNGYVAPLRSTTKVAEAIMMFVALSPNERTKMTLAARQSVAERVNGATTVAVFRDL